MRNSHLFVYCVCGGAHRPIQRGDLQNYNFFSAFCECKLLLPHFFTIQIENCLCRPNTECNHVPRYTHIAYGPLVFGQEMNRFHRNPFCNLNFSYSFGVGLNLSARLSIDRLDGLVLLFSSVSPSISNFTNDKRPRAPLLFKSFHCLWERSVRGD